MIKRPQIITSSANPTTTNNLISILSNYKSLEDLDCRDNHITILKDMPKLKILDCRDNHLKHFINLGNFRNVEL